MGIRHPMFEKINWAIVDSQELADLEASRQNIYTDGSKDNEGVGAAFIVVTPNGRTETQKFRLAPHCTVFQAELLALCEALKWLNNRRTKVDTTIYTDSRSALEAVNQANNPHPLVHELQRAIRAENTSNTIKLAWVKAHIGIVGNEMADQAARKAAALRGPAKYSKVPLSYAKRVAERKLQTQWERLYAQGPQGAWTRKLLPRLKGIRELRENVKTTTASSQFLTNKAWHRQHLAKIGAATSSMCPCGAPEQNWKHLMEECPEFRGARTEYIRRCKRENITPFDWEEAIRSKAGTTHWFALIEAIAQEIRTYNG